MTAYSRRPLSWRSFALPASIVLNLFLAALIGGHLWQGRSNDDGTAGSVLSRALRRAEAALPPNDAAAFGAVLQRDATHYAQSAQQLSDAREAFWRQVTAEHVDRRDLRQALDAWRAAWNRFLDDFSDTIVAALAEVSPEGRRKLTAERRFQLTRPIIEVPPSR
jgi:uncharacterized membrane protein